MQDGGEEEEDDYAEEEEAGEEYDEEEGEPAGEEVRRLHACSALLQHCQVPHEQGCK